MNKNKIIDKILKHQEKASKRQTMGEMTENEFNEKLEKVYKYRDGRLENILKEIPIKKICFDCGYFVNAGKNNKEVSGSNAPYYKCCVSGSCIAATLREETLMFIVEDLNKQES